MHTTYKVRIDPKDKAATKYINFVMKTARWIRGQAMKVKHENPHLHYLKRGENPFYIREYLNDPALAESKGLVSWKLLNPDIEKIGSMIYYDVLKVLGETEKGMEDRIKRGNKETQKPYRNRRVRMYSITPSKNSKREWITDIVWERENKKGTAILRLPNHPPIKIILTRPIVGTVNNIRLLRDGKTYYASISASVEPSPIEKSGKVIGVDWGVKSLFTLSDGQDFNTSPEFEGLRKLYSNIGEAYKFVIEAKAELESYKNEHRRSRTERSENQSTYVVPHKKNNEFKKLNRTLSIAQRKWHNLTSEFHNQLVNWFLKSYDIIVVEELKKADMRKNSPQADQMNVDGWAEFIRKLIYRGNMTEKQVTVVAAKNTSQICHNCKRLSDFHKDHSWREWDCPHADCGEHIDRDYNAAKNILERGIIYLTDIGALPTGIEIDYDLSRLSEPINWDTLRERTNWVSNTLEDWNNRKNPIKKRTDNRPKNPEISLEKEHLVRTIINKKRVELEFPKDSKASKNKAPSAAIQEDVLF